MQELLIDWKYLLETNGSTLGLVLVIPGLSLLLGGWRLERFTLLIVYALAGMVAGRIVSGGQLSFIFSATIGIATAVILGVLLRKYAAPALAGVFGLAGVWAMFQNSFVPVAAIYVMMVITFIAIAAVAFSNLRTTTILLSSLSGAVLLASGLAAMLMDSRFLAPHFNVMSAYAFFYPFVLLVCTVSGTFLQMSAASRTGCGEAAT